MAARNMDDITELFKTLKFRKKWIGGVNERHVWKQLETVQREYRSAYEIQEERYKALLEERDEEIRRLKEQISREPAHE